MNAKTTQSKAANLERQLLASGRQVLKYLKTTKMSQMEALSTAMEAQKMVDEAIRKAIEEAQKSPANKLPPLERMKHLDRVINQARTKTLSAYMTVEMPPYED